MKIGKGAVVSVAAGILLTAGAGAASAAETATATISSSALGAGVFEYDIAVKNTSADSSQIGTFWFSWIPGVDYMEAKPTNIAAPTGWIFPITGSNNGSDGNAIEFYNLGGAGDQLTAGNTFNFSFDSTETLTQILGASSYSDHELETTAYVYAGFPETDAGFKLNVSAVPEPMSCAVLLGTLGMLGIRRPRRA